MTHHRTLFAILLTLFTACASAPSQERIDAISAELSEMGRVDQEIRNAWLEAEKTKSANADEVRQKVIEIDRANTQRLRELIDAIGWPRRSQFGKEPANGAWLIAQHTSDHAFQAHVLDLLRPLLDEGEVPKQAFALLDDRVRCNRGEPQLYGTQYRKQSIDGVMHFGPLAPIADPEHLNERRASMGLEPHADYLKALRELFGIGDDAVIDP